MRALNPIRIDPWGENDLPLLEATLGVPEMTMYLGGPESPEQLASRQERYVNIAKTGPGNVFKIIDVATDEPAGTIGYWEQVSDGEAVWETGWSVLVKFQNRGYATLAGAQITDIVRAKATRRYLHAFPSVENGASNAVCWKLGFELIDQFDDEYPPGNPVVLNNWRFDLSATKSESDATPER